MRFYLSLSVSCVLLAGGGCDQLMYGSGAHPRWPRYSIGFANDTDEQFRQVRVEWTENRTSWKLPGRILSSGAEATLSDAPDPIPQQATVVWQTADGLEHQVVLKVRQRVPNLTFFAGTIWFKFDESGVTMIPQTESNAWLSIHHRPPGAAPRGGSAMN